RLLDRHLRNYRGHPRGKAQFSIERDALPLDVIALEMPPDALAVNHEICEKVLEFWCETLKRLYETSPVYGAFWTHVTSLDEPRIELDSQRYWRHFAAVRKVIHDLAHEQTRRTDTSRSPEIARLYEHIEKLSRPNQKGDKSFRGFIGCF